MKLVYSTLYTYFAYYHRLCTERFTFQADALAAAVHEMHECGVAHKDIKGDNVIIHYNTSNKDCNVVLLDFSLCTTLGPPSMHKLVAMWDMMRWVSF
jgi:serine/threonine protein kinase